MADNSQYSDSISERKSEQTENWEPLSDVVRRLVERAKEKQGAK